MFYLLLNVVFASAFTLIIKWVQVREREDIITVGAINYIVAALWILPTYLRSELEGPTTAAAVTGATMGACYFVAYFFVIHAIRWIGASRASVIGALSILLPIGCGILIWNEQPGITQEFGIVLAVLSLLLISSRRKSEPKTLQSVSRAAWLQPMIFVSFFFLAGSSRLSQEAFKHESDPLHRPVFLITAFFVAAVPSVVLLAARRRRISRSEFGMGLAMGTSNIMQTRFTLLALNTFDGFVVFPVSSAGGLLLTTVVATGVMGEHLDRLQKIGIGAAICALILLNQ